LWEVVGGGDKGGIVVRQGEDTGSPFQIHPRIGTGSIVEEVKLTEEGRLCFNRLWGFGPNFGWCSIKLKDGKDLLVRTDRQPPLPEPRAPPSPVSGRKLRLLLVHGAKANRNIMKFQLMPLKVALGPLGKSAEWIYVDAPLETQIVKGSSDPLVSEPTEAEQKLAGKLPFLQWYTHGNATFGKCKEGADCLKKQIMENLPIDAVVAYSQGACQISMLLNYMRLDGATGVPWKLNVFFSGGQVDDPKYQFNDALTGPFQVPTIRVYNNAADDYFAGSTLIYLRFLMRMGTGSPPRSHARERSSNRWRMR